jgi:hypothetical protein
MVDDGEAHDDEKHNIGACMCLRGSVSTPSSSRTTGANLDISVYIDTACASMTSATTATTTGATTFLSEDGCNDGDNDGCNNVPQ